MPTSVLPHSETAPGIHNTHVNMTHYPSLYGINIEH